MNDLVKQQEPPRAGAKVGDSCQLLVNPSDLRLWVHLNGVFHLVDNLMLRNLSFSEITGETTNVELDGFLLRGWEK
jgi:hypothetical protein